MKLDIGVLKRQRSHCLQPGQFPGTNRCRRDSSSTFHAAALGSSDRGFTLLELMMVLTLILILASFAFPSYRTVVVHGREAVLSNDLFVLRKVIDQFTVDKHHPPSTLDALVEAGYLRGGIPKDPFTNSAQTWVVDTTEDPSGSGPDTSGIVDIHSGSALISLNGTPYSSW